MLYNILNSALSLIIVDRCMVCNEVLKAEMHGICLKCRLKMPKTNFCFKEHNPVKAFFDPLARVNQCSAFFLLKTDNDWHHVIHEFKYRGKRLYAQRLGTMYGADLKSSGLYNDIDYVVPIPLHWRKRLKRGYNQSTYLAEGIAKELGAKVDHRTVYRKKNNPSQTLQETIDRWDNVDNIFALRNAKQFANKHILLVDDVLTTGATICSCINSIHRVTPNCRISVATLAIARDISLKY